MSEELKVRDDRFEKVEKRLEAMHNRAKEFCQTRSNFQIEKFICEDEYTPITKFRHVGHNSYVALQEVRRMLIERERTLRKIERMQKAYDEYCKLPEKDKIDHEAQDYDLDIYEASRQLEDMEIRLQGLLREIDYMETICERLEKEEIEKTGEGFTAKKYQEQEPEYWAKRFAMQMHQSQIGALNQIGEGNYRSYIQALTKPVLDDGLQIEPFNIQDLNSIAVKALIDKPGVNEILLNKKEEEPKLEE